MKFQVGDTVLVLHSNEEGKVQEIINDKMVLVEVRGVRFPAYTDQLDFPYFKRFTEQRQAARPKEKRSIEQVPAEKPLSGPIADEGVWISFLPVSFEDEFGDEIVDSLKIHLVNRSPASYQFAYSQTLAGRENFRLENELLPGKDFYLHDIPFEQLNDSPSFDVDFRLAKYDKKKADHYERSFKPKAKQFFLRIEEMRRKGDATISFRILDEYPDRAPEIPAETPDYLAPLRKAGYKIYDASESRRHLEEARYVVDLHIEKLRDDWRGLSNFEILSHQLQTFEKYLDLAIAHHQHNLVVIHGVGKGKLRDEIHDILKTRSEVKSFVNQYDPRYGYGATEIFFK